MSVRIVVKRGISGPIVYSVWTTPAGEQLGISWSNAAAHGWALSAPQELLRTRHGARKPSSANGAVNLETQLRPVAGGESTGGFRDARRSMAGQCASRHFNRNVDLLQHAASRLLDRPGGRLARVLRYGWRWRLDFRLHSRAVNRSDERMALAPVSTDCAGTGRSRRTATRRIPVRQVTIRRFTLQYSCSGASAAFDAGQ